MNLFGREVQFVPEEKLHVKGIYSYLVVRNDGTFAIKIGEAIFQTIYERLYKQQHVDDITKYVLAIWELPEGLPLGQDKKIHNLLNNYKGDNFEHLVKGVNSGTDEAYELKNFEGWEEIKEQCDTLYGSHTEGEKLLIYKDIIDLVKNVVNNKKSYVLDLCPRFGKTNTCLLLTKELKSKITICVSYVGTVNESYRKTIMENPYTEDFSKIQYVDLDDDDATETIDYAINNSLQVFAYLQCTGTEDGTFERRYSKIKDYLSKKDTTLLIEEADFGMHCAKQLRKIKKIPHKYAYILSGTGKERMQKIADFLKVKEWIIKDYILDLLETSYEDRAKDVAPVKWIRFSNAGLFQQIKDKKPDAAENWSEMATVENGNLKYKFYFEQLITALFNPSVLRWADEKFVDCLENNTLYQDRNIVTEIFVPVGNEAHKLLCDIIERQIPNAIAVPIDGNNTSNAAAEKLIKEIIRLNKNKRIFIICSGMANRSFSIKQIKNVVLLLDCPGQDSVSQKIARGLTAWNGKECRVLDMRLKQEVSNLERWIAPTMMRLAQQGKTYGEIIDIIAACKKVQFYDYFDLNSSEVFKKLNKDDFSKAMYSNDFTELLQGRLDADNVSYNLNVAPSLDIEDKVFNNNIQGGKETVVSSKRDDEESENENNGETGSQLGQKEAEATQRSSKRKHQVFLLNSKSLFYNDFKYKKDIVKSTIKELVDTGKSDEYLRLLKIDLNFLLEIIKLYEKEGYDFDKVVKDGTIKSNNKEANLIFQKAFCNKEKLWDRVFDKEIKSLKSGCKCLIAFWGSYYFINRARQERPDCTFVHLEEQLLTADLTCGSLYEGVNVLVNILKDMRFDKIIMNPPYNRSLHLQILSQAMKHADEVVNLSPIRWLQDPLAEYKKSTNWKRFANIREKIADLEVVPSVDAQKLFNAAFFTNLGIYHIDNEKHDFKVAKDPFIEKMIKDFAKGPRLTYDNDMTGDYELTLPAIHGHVNNDDWKELTSKDYEVAKKVGMRPSTGHRLILRFKTEEERKNFYDSLFTKFFKFFIGKLRTTGTNGQFITYLPWLGDYTHPWTDEMLYDYFDLTQEERKIIENEVR